ncbi:hypothetical protein [Paraflavitalea sp. CAU 1676]|uniref:hypothetical protein n=1 Tax=Paraflavitalea sp. CAU 1676 TaxID=3032598 RepID=UPI0023DC218E|nr:hypothetical protein [Paraflavitalea sp. CAU 1676]MDF2189954.1 hypothetical protein [Paraflavitalea sp. CAU 1676]
MKRMSDHDFEKQVQLKLEQLKLRPSTTVWAEVERNIRLQKRRRRMLIWLPAALLVLVAGGYLTLKPGAHHIDQPIVKKSSLPVSPNNTPSSQNSTPVTATENNTPANTPVEHTNDQAVAATQPAADNQSTTTLPNDNTAPAVKPVEKAPVSVAGKESSTPAVKPVIKQPSAVTPEKTIFNKIVPAPATVKATRKPDSGRKQTGNGHNRSGKKTDQDNGLATNKSAPENPLSAASRAALSPGAPVTALPVVVDSAVNTVSVGDSALAQVTPVDSAGVDTAQALAVTAPATQIPAAQAPDKKSVAKNIQSRKSGTKESKWQFGAQAEAGSSGITQDGLFGLNQEAAVADLAMNSFAPQFPRPVVTKASNLTMGLSFSVGGFAQRKLSNRLSLSAGVQYAYLSARQVVGTKVENNRTVNRAPAFSQMVSSYYGGNNTEQYTNKYHFLEIPVTLHAQLNKGERLPIGWDVGFSVSKLLNTNALHYDGLGGVYYKDNSLFNKVQWAASTGFFVKLFHNGNHPLSVGPVLRYNMTPLLQKEFSTGQHLWSVALRASVLLKK